MPGDSKKEYWIGFDLGGTKMLATIFDESFNPLGKERKKNQGALRFKNRTFPNHRSDR